MVSEIYSVEDCLYYTDDWSSITSNWTKDTSVSGRSIYKLATAYQYDVELTCKLKGTIPSNFMLGFGDTGGSPTYWGKMLYYRNNGSLTLFVDNASISIGSPSITTSNVLKLKTSNLHTIYSYIDDTLYAYRTTNSSHALNLRIDDFGDTLELDYIRVKPL